MAYLGSTAASSVANPPTCIVPKVIGGIANTTALSTANGTNVYQEQGGAVWLYKSSHVDSTSHFANGFFTDAQDLGMRPGDIVIAVGWTTAGSTVTLGLGVLNEVSSTGAFFSTGQLITST
jgi:hypothetical protein